MLEPESELWRWLAEQPPFIEVGIGVAFVVLLAPAVLTAAAWLLTRIEVVVEGIAEAHPLPSLLLSGTKRAGRASATKTM
jgi:hypothetical protein